MNRKRFNFTSSKGLTLIEVVVSITILTTTVVALTGLARTAIHTGTNAANRTKAYSLAQEVIEKVRQLRDYNWQNGKAWDDSIDVPTVFNSLTGFSLDPPSGKYVRTVENTKYAVTLEIVPVTVEAAELGPRPEFAGTKLKKKVIVSVHWQGTSGAGTVVSETYFTDWKSGT